VPAGHAVLGWQASKLTLNASFEKTIPASHPYIQNYKANESQLSGLGNAVRIVVANPARQHPRRAVHGHAAQAQRRGLPAARRRPLAHALAVDAQHALGRCHRRRPGGRPRHPRPVRRQPGEPAAAADQHPALGQVGQLVALDLRSSMVFVPLLPTDAQGRPLDYNALSQQLEELRSKYAQAGVSVHITGFAKIVGDLIEGVRAVLLFFAIAVVIAAPWCLPTPAACAPPRWWCAPRWWPWCGSWACCRCWASRSTRTPSSCPSSCSPSA
jgi:uncharacterized protein